MIVDYPKGISMKNFVLFMLIIILPVSLWGLDRPSALEVKKVIDYYKYAKDSGVILVESTLCHEIYRSGPKKNDPQTIATTTSFKKGEKVYLWMKFLVPEKLKANIHFEYRRKGKVRVVDDLLISTATRYRSWKKLPTNKTGTWEIFISQELENRDIELSTITYTVD